MLLVDTAGIIFAIVTYNCSCCCHCCKNWASKGFTKALLYFVRFKELQGFVVCRIMLRGSGEVESRIISKVTTVISTCDPP